MLSAEWKSDTGWLLLSTQHSALHPARGMAGSSDRKSTRLNSSHANISYAVFCLKKKAGKDTDRPLPTLLWRRSVGDSCHDPRPAVGGRSERGCDEPSDPRPAGSGLSAVRAGRLG